ncbi:MAG TPA: sugar-binding domain-containing protein [Actinomycetales bacterium]|nr:sugar-binding domain-containing protein [Actinomycetales bacterium]
MPAPRDPELLLGVARLYYLENQSQQEIASTLGISRSNVSRMLTAATDAGIVEIRIHDPAGRDQALEDRMKNTFGLREVRVAAHRRAGGHTDPLAAVGTQAAQVLLENIDDHMTVALSWGRTLQSMVWSTRSEREYAIELVQLVGGLSSISNEISGQELVRELAARLGSPGYRYLHAPAALGSRAARDALLGEVSIASTLDLARGADLAFVGIGTPSHGSSAAILQSLDLSARELARFWDQKPAGDVAARYFDAQGRPVTGAVEGRVLAVSVEDLVRIPTVVGVAAGRAKAEGVLGALRGHLLDMLVCDDSLARAVLAGNQKELS